MDKRRLSDHESYLKNARFRLWSPHHDRPCRLFRCRKEQIIAAKTLAMGDLSRRQKEPDQAI